MASRLNPGLSDAADAHSGLQPFDPTQAQLTLDSIGDAVLCVDAAGVVTYLNAVAADMTGWSTTEAMVERMWAGEGAKTRAPIGVSGGRRDRHANARAEGSTVVYINMR